MLIKFLCHTGQKENVSDWLLYHYNTFYVPLAEYIQILTFGWYQVVNQWFFSLMNKVEVKFIYV